MPRGTKDGSVFHEEAQVDPETGKVVRPERWIVRRRYTDLKGNEREKKRIVYSKRDIGNARREIDREIDNDLAGQSDKPTFKTLSEVIEHCKEKYFKPAIYVGNIKVGGQRTWRGTLVTLKPFAEYFGVRITPATADTPETWSGGRLIKEITYEDLLEYREQRLQTPRSVKRVRYTQRGRKGREEYIEYKQRTVAAVDRELEWARRVFRVAKTKKWITDNPFTEGDPLITKSIENKKLRILSFDEERRLFAAFKKHKTRAHLAFAVMVALETAMRKSEQFRLRHSVDIDLEQRIILALSYKGKRTTVRPVPITELLMPELARRLSEVRTSDQLFDLKDPKKGFENACRDAGIVGVTWHTLRHTAITRMVHVYKIQPLDVMKISGHTNWKTFCETYVNLNEEMVRSIGASIDAARAAMVPLLGTPETISEAIN